MTSKLAILVPCYNGGDLLRTTVESCGRSGLSGDRFEVLVVDNCSTDASTSKLPAVLSNGAPVHVYVNETNLGRVGNWNRALQIAAEGDFTYAVFLFVGDEWLPNGSIGALIDDMDNAGSILGMAAMRIVAQDGEHVRAGARVSITGAASNVASRALIAQAVETGRLPFAPIQANVYRIYNECPLVFDTAESNSLNADIEGTAVFIQQHPGTITIVSSPYLIWRDRPGRYFTAQDPWFVFIETRRTLQRLSDITGLPVNWRSANSVGMLAALRETSRSIPWRRRLAFQCRVFRYLMSHSAGLSLITTLRFLAKKVWSRQSYLVIGHGSGLPSGAQVFKEVADQCRS